MNCSMTSAIGLFLARLPSGPVFVLIPGLLCQIDHLAALHCPPPLEAVSLPTER